VTAVQLPDPLALIIEDDEKLATIFAQALRMASFETQIIRDGREADAKLKSINPDLILLDLHLPGLSGDKILFKIRQDPRLAKTHIIIATADPAMTIDLHDLCDLVLIKPISFTQLRDLALRIRSTLNIYGN
jgi:DNA-binding response OmpR family regulator